MHYIPTKIWARHTNSSHQVKSDIHFISSQMLGTRLSLIITQLICVRRFQCQPPLQYMSRPQTTSVSTQVMLSKNWPTGLLTHITQTSTEMTFIGWCVTIRRGKCNPFSQTHLRCHNIHQMLFLEAWSWHIFICAPTTRFTMVSEVG